MYRGWLSNVWRACGTCSWVYRFESLGLNLIVRINNELGAGPNAASTSWEVLSQSLRFI